MPDMLKSLFINLSKRFNDENCLSDVTWALAKADPQFISILMELFGFEFSPKQNYEISREISHEDSRPDFLIEQGGKQFIIENKIWDKSDHFEQYAQSFQSAQRGFIANYEVDSEIAQKYHFKCRTWETFLKKLSKEINDGLYDNLHKSILESYLEYVKEVCEIVDLKDIRLDNLVSLYYFNKVIEKIIHSPLDGFECWPYNKVNSFEEDDSARCFCLKRTNNESIIYPFFGIWYGDTPIIIYLSFDKEWCKSIYNHYQTNKIEDGLFFKKPYFEQNNCVFELKENIIEEFSKTSLENQIKILHNFFSEVINEIGKCI